MAASLAAPARSTPGPTRYANKKPAAAIKALRGFSFPVKAHAEAGLMAPLCNNLATMRDVML